MIKNVSVSEMGKDFTEYVLVSNNLTLSLNEHFQQFKINHPNYNTSGIRLNTFITTYCPKLIPLLQQNITNTTDVTNNHPDINNINNMNQLDNILQTKQFIQPPNIIDNLNPLIAILPQCILNSLSNHSYFITNIVDLVFDLHQPFLFYQFSNNNQTKKYERVIIHDLIINEEIIHSIVNQCEPFSAYDNRSGIPNCLHRISRRLSKLSEIIGLTIRIARISNQLSQLIEEELLQDKNILVLGKPGVGKSTFLRSCSNYISQTKRVEIIDTSSEIAGHSIITHECVGYSRRMFVNNRNNQHQIMLEAVQNHTPDCIIIDEIGNEMEVLACQDISQRGVQMIATVHGKSIYSLMSNPIISKVLGSIHTVILSSREVLEKNLESKTIRERMNDSSFDILIEIIKPGVILIIQNINQAVDNILSNQPIDIQLRYFEKKSSDNSYSICKKNYKIKQE